MDKDLLKGIYDDLYTAGKSTLGDLKKTAEDVRKTMKESRDTARTSETVLKNANDTIEEAKKLFGDPTAPANQLPEAAATAAPAQEEKPLEPETDPMEDLDALIGLSDIKHDVKELMAFVKIQKMRKDEGLKSVPTSLHLVFTGNPGTGKTTVARIIGRLYRQIGVLSKGQLVEVDRSGLVAGYVGQTAIKTQERIKEAMGGVLFIDEAYALAGGEQDAFGQEAINTILKAMEDNRDDLVIIVAGYTEPMERFINSNPGLKSRFNKYIEFSDYTIDELEQMFYMNCKKYDYTVEEDVTHQIRAMIVARKFANLENFANGREVRNLFEEIITNQARRIAKLENPTHEDMMTITLEDLVDTGEEETPSGKAPEDTSAEVPEDAPAEVPEDASEEPGAVPAEEPIQSPAEESAEPAEVTSRQEEPESSAE